MTTRAIAIASFLFTAVFFIEYTPLARRVHIPFDLAGYHFPLADYAFQSLRQGRFPQWDPTIYCGLSYAGNAQAALFYPPSWLLPAMNWGRSQLSYQSLQNLTLTHVWLAFLLCWLWLRRERALHPLAAALGAGVFAFSGFLLLNLQHFGVVAGYAWMPLGFSGIDAARRLGKWRPLWKLAAASALCFLAGYPPMWVVFALCMLAYGVASKSAFRDAAWTAVALAASLPVTAVQLLPAWEATRLAVPEARYDRASGVKDPAFFLSYFAPNFNDFGLETPVHTNPGREYLYLGAAAFSGAGPLLFRARLLGAGPPLAVAMVSLLFLVNPFGIAGRIIEQSAMLAQVFSAWYFLAGLTASAALLAALGLDLGLNRAVKPCPAWLSAAALALSLGWSISLLLRWTTGSLAVGWLSALDALAATVLCGLLIFIYPASTGRFRLAVALAVLTLTAADYKAFGTSKRFNAYRGPYVASFKAQPFPGMNPAAYRTIREHPEYRIVLDQTALFPQDLRHNSLTTPQGFDPLLPAQYKLLINRIAHFRTNREFDIDPENLAAARLLGVRYFVTSEQGPMYKRLSASPGFRLLLPDDSYHKVFEISSPRPVFGWESPEDGSAEPASWEPERRVFLLRSNSGGRFRLTEQFFPGWSATLDGAGSTIHRCREAFQCVDVPPGEHRLEFRYRSRWLLPGAVISFCSALLLAMLATRPLLG
ncbi:MAG TPA: hypothetical protein VL285_03470 [Bryobacteraceae bacterium]|nr:hypothetical protein [Bryobacteraceae bacterium]